jgi:hypothetical protein
LNVANDGLINIGRTIVENWSFTGHLLVLYWSNTDITLVGDSKRKTLVQLKLNTRILLNLQLKYWSNGQGSWAAPYAGNRRGESNGLRWTFGEHIGQALGKH